MPNICILGLGNPEPKYIGTRHNIGKDWVLRLIQNQHYDLQNKTKLDASVAESKDGKVLWGYPNLYVNESGACVSKILRTSSLELSNILVIHDDLDLPIGSLKLKTEGGHGGHNGLRSIISTSGSDFLRLRVGIGHPGTKTDVTNWVLGSFKPDEKEQLEDAFIEFLNIIELLADRKIAEAQLKLHSK